MHSHTMQCWRSQSEENFAVQIFGALGCHCALLRTAFQVSKLIWYITQPHFLDDTRCILSQTCLFTRIPLSSPWKPLSHYCGSLKKLTTVDVKEKKDRQRHTHTHSGLSGRLVIWSNSQFWVDHYMQMVDCWLRSQTSLDGGFNTEVLKSLGREKVEESAIWILTALTYFIYITPLLSTLQLMAWWCRYGSAEKFTLNKQESMVTNSGRKRLQNYDFYSWSCVNH